MSLDNLDITDCQRREAGWIMLEGLLHLGNQWASFKLTTIYKLWNSVFSKDMCSLNVEKVKARDKMYIEKILLEF